MGNTVFYEEVRKDKPKIGWKEILGDSFKKHSMSDLEYALAAGSVYDTANPETMLKKWHKPWVWTRVFMLLAVTGLAFYLLMQAFGTNPNIGYPMLIILACVTPIASMTLFWELNVARDVSFIKLLGCFFVGGVLSLFFTLLLGETGVEDVAVNITKTDTGGLWALWVAPITEEPAKLLAGWIILWLLAKKGCNIFGCTGIAVGAGVGTGFTLFESFGYVLTYALYALIESNTWEEVFKAGLEVVKARSIPGINGHMLMCVPYIAVIALTYHETRDWTKSIFNKRTVIAFIASCLLHAWWDCMGGVAFLFLGFDENTTFATQAAFDAAQKSYDNSIIIQSWVITVLYFISNLLAIRLCLQQAVREGDYSSGQSIGLGEGTSSYSNVNVAQTALTVTSVGEALPGMSWQCRDTVIIGKMNECAIQFPPETAGISRVHCRLKNCGSYWTVCDLGSSYGTRVNGVRLNANMEYQISPGTVLELGSSKVKLRVQ